MTFGPVSQLCVRVGWNVERNRMVPLLCEQWLLLHTLAEVNQTELWLSLGCGKTEEGGS